MDCGNRNPPPRKTTPDHAAIHIAAAYEGRAVVYTKNEWQKALASRKQHALQQARERDQWSGKLHKAREDNYLAELGRLKQQIAEIESERDVARRQVQLLESSLAKETSRKKPSHTLLAMAQITRPSIRTITFMAVFVMLSVLVSVTTFHDAQSMVNAAQQSTTADALAGQLKVSENGAVAGPDNKTDKKKKAPPPKTKKGKTRFAVNHQAEHRQWGPPLLLTNTQAVKSSYAFDPLVKELQRNLLILGFDIGEADGFKGARTRQALHEFQSLYLAGAELKKAPVPGELATILKNYAAMAQADASKFNVDRGVVAAIRLSSVRTGVEFSYLMELAAVESNFDPVSKAPTSSATGLFQFTDETWLNTLKSHGHKYGLADYVSQIEFYVDRRGYQRPMVRDASLYQHLMDLRMNPRVSAMMVADTIKDNLQTLTFSFNRTPVKTDLYLTHFLGTEGAVSFLKTLDENPDAFAVELFPVAAQSNQNIFHPKTCKPRTVNEVYELFGRKFNTSRYNEWASN